VRLLPRHSRRSPITRFLSDCHTGALVAPMGDRLALRAPLRTRRASSAACSTVRPEAFGSGPSDQPSHDAHLRAGHENVLATTWKSPSGGFLVHDALTIGPGITRTRSHRHTRPPADDDADHLLVRTVLCLEGRVEVELICEPAFDYGRVPAAWSVVDGDRPPPTPRGRSRRSASARIWRWGSRAAASARATSSARRAGILRALVGGRTGRTADADEAEARIAATIRYWRAWSTGPGFPTTVTATRFQRSALAIKGLTYMPTGAAVAALTTSLRRRRAESAIGLPLHVDAGATFMLRALTRSTWTGRRRLIQFVADVAPTEDGSLQIMYGIDGRRSCLNRCGTTFGLRRWRPVRVGNAASVSAERHLRRPSSTRSCSTPAATSACRAGCGRSFSRRRRRYPCLADLRPGHLGGPCKPRHYVSSSS